MIKNNWLVLVLALTPFSPSLLEGQTSVVRVGQNNTYTSGYQNFNAGTLGLPSGAVDPATCNVGDRFVNTNGVPGIAKTCLTTDTWSIDILGVLTNADAVLCVSASGVVKECNAASTFGGTITLLGSGNVATVQGTTATTLDVTAGSAQSTTPLQQWRANGGGVLAKLSSTGQLFAGPSLSGVAVTSDLGGVSTPVTPTSLYIAYNGTTSDAGYIDSAGVGTSSGLVLRRARGTLDAMTDVADNDQIGYIDFRSYSGTKMWQQVSIVAHIDGTYTTGQAPPARLQFATNTANGVSTERMRIDKSGYITIGSQGAQFGGTGHTMLTVKQPAADADFAIWFQAGTTTSNSNGIRLQAGTNASDNPLYITTADGTTPLLGLKGSGALQFGGTGTSLSQISPGIIGVGTGAAGSTAGTLQAANIQGNSGLITGASGVMYWQTRAVMTSPADGILAITNNASTADSGTLQVSKVVGGSTTSSPLILQPSNNAGAAIAGADVIFKGGTNGGTELMRVLGGGASIGNVGIGVAASTVRLHLKGANALLYTQPIADDGQLTGLQSLNSSGAAVGGITTNSLTGEIAVGSANSAYSTTIYGGTVARIKVLSTGSVGIGSSNTSPTGTLHVYDATATTGVTRLWVREGAGQSTGEVFGVYANDGTTKRFIVEPAISYWFGGNTSITASGTFATVGSVSAGAASYLSMTGRSRIYSPASGVLQLTDDATTDFGRLQFGGTTSAFPALKRSTTGLIARLADDSADTWFRSIHVAGGSTPSVGTCGTIGTGSMNNAGFITSDVTGSCVSVLTFTGYTATTGWSCGISNGTTSNLITQTGSSTTSATFTGTTVTGDILRYVCTAY